MERTVRILKMLEQMMLLITMNVHSNTSALITRKHSLRPRMRIALRVLMGRIFLELQNLLDDLGLARLAYSRTSRYRKMLRLNSNSTPSNQDCF